MFPGLFQLTTQAFRSFTEEFAGRPVSVDRRESRCFGLVPDGRDGQVVQPFESVFCDLCFCFSFYERRFWLKVQSRDWECLKIF